LLDEAQYDGAFSFKYSPRPNTPSLKMEDAIPEEEKSRRLAILIERQREIQRARNERLVGKSFEVMVEGKSKRELQWSGHTSSNKVMNFTSTREESLGDYVQVRVVGATPNSLVGERVGAEGDRSVEGSFGELVAGIPPLCDPARKKRAEEKAGSLRSG
jgi:tRNA-2-methylthio-N6-dimethylallyladenosine synthase